MVNNQKKDNPNKGHRQRVKERYLANCNLDNFQDYEVLELMLFYAYPMKDTKPIAKKLISQFGSLHNLLSASPQQIVEESGLTENVAIFLTLFNNVSRQAIKNYYKKGKIINSMTDAMELLEGILSGQPYESFFMVSLNSSNKVLAVDRMSDGNKNSALVTIENVVKKALLHDASFVIIGHNHPSGYCEPSKDDYDFTYSVMKSLESVKITLKDHIIICGKKNFSFAKVRYFGLELY